MEQFIPGQRWISSTESELGLGIILEAVNHRVTVLFLASDQKRVYAQGNSPLVRVKFAVGDFIESTGGDALTVASLSEKDGLVTYFGKNQAGIEVSIGEMELNPHIQFNKPQERLFSGQFDPFAWFSLRYETWRQLRRHQLSPVRGLMGGRTSLIPHQVYIAYEAANRQSPRVMLADEVGLGKTIEAGLILHHQLLNGLARRVLIIVPEALLHQWLVEMLRRFNLKFSIIDEKRYADDSADNDSFDESGRVEMSEDNPFMFEQLVLCSQTFFSVNPLGRQQALAAGWDMIVVDEAHHLEWNESSPCPEYQFVEQLGQASVGLLLLTATPEQLGKRSHFARLRLLDPDRFYSFSEFLNEERLFEPVARAAQTLLDDHPVPDESIELLGTLLKNDSADALLAQINDPERSKNAREQLVNILLDYHGTGRVLFRNSRQTVQGFPKRKRYPCALSGPAAKFELQEDQRFSWLVEKVKELSGQKALLICKEAETARVLELQLRNRAGIASALFHEGMTIIERDRSAAFFADQESSARLLICSEIGSEGRNFQFVHHLILWDLPESPDLLQQRIGRLDRIGQRSTIEIHLPFLRDTSHERWFRWYDEGLDAFVGNSFAAQAVADSLREELKVAMTQGSGDDFERMIGHTRELKNDLEDRFHRGRDQLLELNSCRKEQADRLITLLESYENEGSLWPYLEDVFECYGIETEYHSPNCFILRPGNHLRVAHFPGVPEDGVTVTVNRSSALAREDFQFLTWEHPMVTAAMDRVLSSETGNASVSVTKNAQLKPGQFLLECLFIIECSAPDKLQISRFLPSTPVRILIDQQKRDLTDAIAHEELQETGIGFDKNKIVAFINHQRGHIGEMLAMAERRARNDMSQLIDNAGDSMQSALSAELKRLISLKKVNPNIKLEEIDFIKKMMELTHENILAAQLRLDAVRLVITA